MRLWLEVDVDEGDYVTEIDNVRNPVGYLTNQLAGIRAITLNSVSKQDPAEPLAVGTKVRITEKPPGLPYPLGTVMTLFGYDHDADPMFSLDPTDGPWFLKPRHYEVVDG